MSTKKVYEDYFSLIDSYFGPIKHYLSDDKMSHAELGRQIASYPLISDLILDSTDDLDKEIFSFWDGRAKEVIKKVEDSSELKCLFSGDITPVNLENFVKKSVLYVDSIIIPDPIINLCQFQRAIISDKKYYLNKLIRHVFNVYKLKDIILSDTTDRPLLVLPINISLLDSSNRKSLLMDANKNFVNYINLLFETQNKNPEECFEYMSKFAEAKEIFVAVKQKNKLPPAFRELNSMSVFLNRFETTSKYVRQEVGKGSTGWHLALYFQSQFIRVQEHHFFCNMLGAEPIYDYDLPWYFYSYQFDDMGIDSGIINALQTEKFDWIGNKKIPLAALKELREKGELDYMRSVLRKGITDLKIKNDDELLKTSLQLEQNISEAFARQKSEIKKLEQEVSDITKKEIPITIGASIIGFVPWLGSAVSLLTAGRDVRSLLKKRSESKKHIEENKDNTINLLMDSDEEK